jgi:hypothetical protein
MVVDDVLDVASAGPSCCRVLPALVCCGRGCDEVCGQAVGWHHMPVHAAAALACSAACSLSMTWKAMYHIYRSVGWCPPLLHANNTYVSHIEACAALHSSRMLV